jgi:thiol-disulfide isomerase/thioredoxin
MSEEEATGEEEAAPAPEPERVPRVVPLRTIEDWDECTAKSTGLIVALFGASWSTPCQRMMPTFLKYASDPDFEHMTFALIDADDELLFAARGIRAVPSYQLIFLGEKLASFSGDDELKLRSEIMRVQDALVPPPSLQVSR